jgi:hypothetical protein
MAIARLTVLGFDGVGFGVVIDAGVVILRVPGVVDGDGHSVLPRPVIHVLVLVL